MMSHNNRPIFSRFVAAIAGLIIAASAHVVSSAEQKPSPGAIRSKAENAEEKLLSRKQSDILIKQIRLTNDNRVEYTIANSSFAPVERAFLVDIYVGNSHRDRIRHSPIFARASVTTISENASVLSCQGSWIRVVADSEHDVAEKNESNNERRQLERKSTCPDLAITYGPAPKKHAKVIGPDAYLIQVVVGNVGTAPMPRSAVAEILYGHKGLKHVLRTEVPPLDPQKTEQILTSEENLSWRTGWVVDVRLDPTNVIDEYNEQNNRKRWSN